MFVQNIRKLILYLLSSNAAEILLVLVCTSINAPTPFTTLQILFANLIGIVMSSLSHTCADSSQQIFQP